jgi:GT2 family glycosyltransferase
MNETDQPFIVLVDNASNDRDKLEELHQNTPNLKVIFNETNLGFGKANNIGIQWAQEHIDFEFLLLLNNDTIITKFALSQTIKNFDLPNVGLVSCRIMYNANKEHVWYGGAEINYKRGVPIISDIAQKPSKEGALKSREVEFISGCFMMFSKLSIAELKGFDERFFMYVEDVEICLRAREKGIKIWYDSNNVIYHQVQGSFTGESKHKGLHPLNPNIAFQFYERMKNQWITFKEHLSGWELFQFVFVFWSRYWALLLKLFLKSPQRWKVLKAHHHILFPGLFKSSKKLP